MPCREFGLKMKILHVSFSLFFTAQIDNFLNNNNKRLGKKNGSAHRKRAEAISGRIMRWHPFDSWVILCGCHDNWVRPPIKPTSAVISSPKSFVIALICILQLSALAHSKNNQPSLKTGDRIIIISVDLYKTPPASFCLTSTLCRQPGFILHFSKIHPRV